MQVKRIVAVLLPLLLWQVLRSCKGCTINDVRLQDNTWPTTGRVEVCNGAETWYSICTRSIGLAYVVCRQLDYCGPSYITSTPYNSSYFKEVDCTGHESDLSSCSVMSLIGSCSQAVVVGCRYVNTPNSPSNPSISILSSILFSLTWSYPSTSSCRNIDGYRVTCTAPGCPGLNELIQTNFTIYSADVTSCNYRCCIRSYNSAGSSSSRCTSLSVPGRPNSVRGTVQSPQSVQISWSHPSTNYYHITGYLVSYNNPFYQEMQTTSTSLTIDGLTLTAYTFYVSANSVAGRSSNSLTTVTIATAPPRAPPWLLATNLSSTSFTLNWDRPSNIYNQPYSFSISCDETSYSNTGAQLIATNLNSVSYTVRSLQPGATYQCCVSAVNNAGENSICNDTHTLEIAPTEYPANLGQHVLNPTAIMLSWIEPPYRQRNGIIRYYAVRVCQIEPEGQCEDHRAAGTTTLELSLHPHYRYSWTVAAYTVAMGPYSQSTFQMPEDKPSGPPRNVSHGSLNASSVQLFWSPPPPEDQNGIITRYNVYILNADNIFITGTSEVGVMTTIESLEEFTTFWFRLSAVTVAGEGPYTVYGPVTTAIGLQYKTIISCGALALAVAIATPFMIVMCLCWRKRRQRKAKTKNLSGTKNEHQSINKQKGNANEQTLSTSEQKQKVNTLAVLYGNKPERKDKPKKRSTLQRMKNLFKNAKNTETPPIPTRRYLEDDDFMVGNFDGQPAIPSRATIMDQVSAGPQRSDDEPAVPPRTYLLDNTFVQGLEAFVAEVSGKDAPDLGDEDKIYQPLIPPRRYEESCQDDPDVYQALTSNRSKSDFREVTILSEETRFAADSENHYQPLVKRAEQSVYEMMTVGGGKDGENKNIETVPNNSEGHYQPLMKREEPSDYQPISTCVSGRGQTSFVMQSESNSEEGHYQALVRKQEENTYQSLTLTLHRDTVV